MAKSKTNAKTIRLSLKNAANGAEDVTDHASTQKRFSALAASVNDAYRGRFGGSAGPADAIGLLAIVGDFLPLMQSLDGQYGADGELPVNDAAGAVDEALRCLAELESWLDRLELHDLLETLHGVQLAVAYWAMRHQLPIYAAEPVINALAIRSNAAETRQETAAVYALMQGFIQHLSPGLQADLEKSNPERAWRLLNLNFAITAIRTGDAAMMRYAFDTLNSNLPDECAGFYQEAHSLASQPGFPPDTRALIEAEYARWTQVH